MGDERKKDFALLLDNLRHALYMREGNLYTEEGNVFYFNCDSNKRRRQFLSLFERDRLDEASAFISFTEYKNILEMYKRSLEAKVSIDQINQKFFWIAHLAGWKRQGFTPADTMLSNLFRDTEHSPKIYGQELKKDLDNIRYKVIDGKTIFYMPGASVTDGVSEDTAQKSQVISEYIVMCNYHIVSEYCAEGEKQLLKKVIKGFADNIVDAERKRQQEGKHSLVPYREKEVATLCKYLNCMMEAYDRLPRSKTVKKDWLLARSLSWLVIGAMLRQSLSKDLLKNHLKPFLPEVDEHGIVEIYGKQRIPQCLTIVPSVNRTIGLVGRDDTVKKIRSILKETRGRILVYGIGGVGKTAVMQWICNDLTEEGEQVAWIKCGSSLKEDILILRTALGITEDIGRETACDMIINAIDTQLGGELFLFLDDLPGSVCSDDIDMLISLNAHVMITSRVKNDDFFSHELNVLEPDDAVNLFCKYYWGSEEKRTDHEKKRLYQKLSTR